MKPKGRLPGQRKSGIPDRISWLKTLPKRSVGAEIGVLKGKFSEGIVSIVKPRLFYLIDCWCAIEGSSWYDKDSRHLKFVSRALRPLAVASAQGRIRPLCGWSTEVVDLVPDATLDWIYIDGDHRMEGCLADLKAWYPKIKPGGIIGGHDYEYGWGCAVPEAVTRFIRGTLGREIESVHTTDVQPCPTFWFKK